MATTTLAFLTTLSIFGSLAHSHMIMNTPTPYNFQGTSRLVQVNPLSNPAFSFPCQGLTDTVSVTPLTAGSTQLVRFTVGAQHGGGSCQFSLTYDFPPPADKTRWKTIYTLIGGCPVSAAGNLPVTSPDQDGRQDAAHCGNDSGVGCIREFEVPLPRDLPNGNATFAWTWFNKIGNREVYMNCAPVSISGGTGDEKAFAALPALFLANVEGECTTGLGVLNIPNPGLYGRVLEPPMLGSEGNCPKAAGMPVFEGDSGSGNGSAEVVSSTIPVSAPVASAPSASTAFPAPSGFVTLTTSAGDAVTSTATGTAPVPKLPNATTIPGLLASQPCSPNGALICFDPTSFGLCANGRAIPQPVAAGTTCNNGKIQRRRATILFW